MTILLRQFASCATLAFIAAILIAAPAIAAEPGSEAEFDQLMTLVTERLDLSPYQVETIRPRLREQLDDMRELFASYRHGRAGALPALIQEFDERREQFRADMDVVLNDQQMLIFEDIRKEVDESIRETVVGFRVDQLRERLGLSDEQIAEVRTIITDNFNERVQLMSLHTGEGHGGAQTRRNLAPEVSQADEKMENRLRKVLTEEQMDEYYDFLAEMRQHLREASAVSSE